MKTQWAVLRAIRAVGIGLILAACLNRAAAATQNDSVASASGTHPKPAESSGTSVNAQANLAGLESYHLVVGDHLRYRVEQDPVKSAESAELLVTALGDVNFPVSRGYDTAITINVLGKTLEQLKQELKAKLDADFYKDATVFLQLVTQTVRFGQVQFFGAMKGLVKLPPGEPKTVTDGILELPANEFANLKEVKVNRVDPKTGKTRTIPVNVKAVLAGDRSKDLPLQDGDRVEVLERTFILFK